MAAELSYSSFKLAYLDNSSCMKLVSWCLETISIILVIMNLICKLKNTWSSAAIPSAFCFWAHFFAFLSSKTYFITCNKNQTSVGSYQHAKHVTKQHPWCYETEIQNTVHPVFLFWWFGMGRLLLWLPPGSSTNQPETIEWEWFIDYRLLHKQRISFFGMPNFEASLTFRR